MDEYRMVDSRDIADFLSGFLSFIKKAINYTRSAVKEHVISSVIVFILIIAAGTYYWLQSGSNYEAEMVCEFNDLSKKTYGEMVLQLDNLAKTRSYPTLAGALHIPLSYARDIISIEGRNMAGSMLYEDVNGDKGLMYFKVTAKNNRVFYPLQDALLVYLNNNSPFKKQRDQIEAASIVQKLDFLKKDISLVDSLLAAYPAMLRNMSALDTVKISSIPALLHYKKDMENETLQQEWRIKELSASVQLLYGFVPPDHAPGRKNKVLAITILMAFALSCFSAVLLQSLHNEKYDLL